MSGFLPVEIRGSTVRLGASTGILRWGAASLGLYHRLDASQFEAVREWIARPPNSLVRRSGEGALLRGMNHRGRYVEFTLMPRDGDVPRLITALERARARAHRPDGTAPTIWLRVHYRTLAQPTIGLRYATGRLGRFR